MTAPTFLEVGWDVMRRRSREARGADRDWSRWRCHVATAPFAMRRVTEIGPREIREWLRAMHQKPALGPGEARTLSRQTIARCQSLVSAVFVEAIERELRDDNPSLVAKLKRRVDERDTIEKWAFLTWAEQCAIAACQAIPYEDRLIIAIAAGTGVRQGEMRHLPLKCVTVDGPDPHLDVRIAGRDKQGRPLPTKSGKPRTVPLLPGTLDAMREWLAILPIYCPENPEGLVFPTRAGKLRQSGKFFGKSDTLRGYYRAAGVQPRPYLHHHALRHTYATNLITGVYGRAWRLEEVQVVMGHSSFAVTQRYAHLGEDTIRKAARETAAAQLARAIPPAPDTERDLGALDATTPASEVACA